MRFFIVLALFTFLVALTNAAGATRGSSQIWLMNAAYKKQNKKGYVEYKNSAVGECINVKKIFNTPDTYIYTLGRPVKLYARADCKDKFHTTKAATNAPVSVKHAIMSFKVGKK
ncbi:hypothetical protein GGI20_005704 [Coemansia sp. BCRC 34301]|nr:hypothetical protein GGI20_005704 [Coemansia sp. BCRC 34301]